MLFNYFIWFLINYLDKNTWHSFYARVLTRQIAFRAPKTSSDANPWTINLFGFPSRPILINLPIANPRKIRVATTNEVNVSWGRNIPDAMRIPPVNIKALTPLISFNRSTSFVSWIPEFFKYVFMGLLNLIAPTKSNKRLDKDRITILKISMFTVLWLFCGKCKMELWQRCVRGVFVFAHSLQNTSVWSYCVGKMFRFAVQVFQWNLF